MFEKFLRVLRVMELEEKVLQTGLILCVLGLFVPWLGGQWAGEAQQWNGFGFYTGFNGSVVFLIVLFIVGMTLSPLLGGPVIVRKQIRNHVRLLLCAMCSVLLLSSFGILLRLTSQVSGAEIRFGIYASIVGSLLATLYAFLKYDEQRKSEVRQLFQHPDEQQRPKRIETDPIREERPMVPPPPPPLSPEDHSLFKP